MTLSIGICLAFVCAPTAQDQDAPEGFVAPKPMPEHAILKKDVGTWKVAITMGAGAQAMKSEGVETVKMLGPFWNVSNMTYKFMGKPVQSHSVMGYDPEKKKFVGSYHESSSPNLTTIEGTWDAAANKLTMMMKGKSPDGKNTQFKAITTYTGNDAKTFEFFMLAPGSETDFVKAMEMNYTRQETKKMAK